MSTPRYTRINLTQQTDEWRQWRRSVIGASDAPVIMGESKWKSIDTLLKEKLGELPEFAGNSQTRLGNQLEPVARSHFEAHAKVLTPPAVVVSTTRPWQAASLDGLSGTGSHVVEIKCGKRAYEITADTGTVPTYYYGQLQHILAVTGLPVIHYCCYWTGRRPLILEVNRDSEYITRLLTAELQFWRRMLGARDRLEPSREIRASAPAFCKPLFTEIALNDSGRYVGWCLDGVPHGKGTLSYQNGDSYEGQFESGARQGDGTYRWADGTLYVGDWVKNARTGFGVATYDDGSLYEGDFLDGEWGSRGRLTFQNGDYYEGGFQDWVPHGDGVLRLATGDYYEGRWRKGAPAEWGELQISISSPVYLNALKAILNLESFMQTSWMRYLKVQPRSMSKRALIIRKLARLIADAERALDDATNRQRVQRFSADYPLRASKARREVLIADAFCRLQVRAHVILEDASPHFQLAAARFIQQFGKDIWSAAPKKWKPSMR